MSFKVYYSNDKECNDLLKVLDKAGFVWHNNLKAMEYKPPLF